MLNCNLFRNQLRRAMSTFNQRNEEFLKHLFDGSDLNVYDNKDGLINLSAGTPSESLLSKCNEIFAKSTQHLLVSN